MGLFVAIALAVVLVVCLGIIIFTLLRRTKGVVPRVVDREGVDRKHAVAVDDEGRPVMASDEEDAFGPHDDAGFEDVLHEELKDLRREP